jgi:hypothetical protein
MTVKMCTDEYVVRLESLRPSIGIQASTCMCQTVSRVYKPALYGNYKLKCSKMDAMKVRVARLGSVSEIGKRRDQVAAVFVLLHAYIVIHRPKGTLESGSLTLCTSR